ncbi:MAG: hypothetical protein D6705_05480 [Deltaproteobacteria bacterium]|nr:MAG: hypothetical protein D6705_05480 [Deltaproteobacteria bacterium]
MTAAPPPGPFVFVLDDAARARIRRRGWLAALALVLLVAAYLVDPATLGVAPFVLEVVAVAALVSLTLALFGLVVGLSCLAQIAFVVWLGGLACAVRTLSDPRSRLWGVVAVAAFALAAWLRRRRSSHGRGAAPAPSPATGGVVDTTAVERDDGAA